MQLTNFKIFIYDVISEANRLKSHDINGKRLTTNRFTDTQVLSLIISAIFTYLLKTGFTDNFAGYTLSFLGVFIGLFTTVVISLFEKKDALLANYHLKTQVDKARIIKTKNYFLQFTGLISYSILLALVLIVLLLLVLLFPEESRLDISNYTIVESASDVNLDSIILGMKNLFVYSHRFCIIYILCAFLTNTLYSTSSYFSFLLSEYKRIRFKSEDHI